MTDLNEKATKDVDFMINTFIENHKDKDEIIEWFIKGPGECGFMYCPRNEQYKKDLDKKILNMGYDSSGYGWFHRLLQQQIIENSKN